jgi:hypothetical protein
MNNCYATGNVTAPNSWRVGGLIGLITNSVATVKHCYASGNVIGEDYVGGLMGQDGNPNPNFSTIQNCMAVNDSITADLYANYISRVTGLYTAMSGPNVSNLYANMNMVVIVGSTPVIKSNDQYTNGTGSTMSTLKSLAFYNTASNWANNTAWSIAPPSGVWNICDGVGLPFLRWQGIICSTGIDTIFATGIGNGIISPSGVITVASGNNQTFTFAENNCYEIDSLWIDGIYNPDSIVSGRYTFMNVSGNHTIKISFKEKTILTVLTVGVCSKDLYVWKGKLLYQSGTY